MSDTRTHEWPSSIGESSRRVRLSRAFHPVGHRVFHRGGRSRKGALENAEVAAEHDDQTDRRGSRHRCSTHTLAEECNLPEEISGSKRREELAVARYAGRATLDHEQ